MRRLLIFQVILVGIVTAGFAVTQGLAPAKASLYGGLMALFNTGLMILHEKRAAHCSDNEAQRIVKHMYLCVVERMVLTLVLFVVGLVALKLLPLQLMLGFIAGQVAAFLNGLSS